MKKSFLLAIAVGVLAGGCATPYEFRNDDRPSYDQTVTAEELVELRNAGATVLDVRLSEDFAADPQLIPDAMYRDPEQIENWAANMSPTNDPVIVYCVRGKWVSQKAANYLSDKGFNVLSLEGGIEGWKDSGGTTLPADR